VSGTRVADDANRGKGYQKDLKSIKFLKHLYFLHDYLLILTEVSKYFQLEDLLLIEISDLVEAAVMKLYQKDEKKFGDLSLTGILLSIDFTKDKDIHGVMFEMSCDSFQILFQCTDSFTFGRHPPNLLNFRHVSKVNI
jgi:hypothetical protein